MATVRDVITYALKQARVLAPGEQLEATEAQDGLDALQSMYDSWVASGMFGRLKDVYATSDDEAEEGKRYLLASGVTITAPTLIETAAWEEGNDRSPRDMAVYETVTSAGVRSVFLFDRTGWVDILGLTLDDDAPLASRGVAGLSASLAVSYGEMFGATVGPGTLRLAGLFVAGLAMKSGTTNSPAEHEYF